MLLLSFSKLEQQHQQHPQQQHQQQQQQQHQQQHRQQHQQQQQQQRRFEFSVHAWVQPLHMHLDMTETPSQIPEQTRCQTGCKEEVFSLQEGSSSCDVRVCSETLRQDCMFAKFKTPPSSAVMQADSWNNSRSASYSQLQTLAQNPHHNPGQTSGPVPGTSPRQGRMMSACSLESPSCSVPDIHSYHSATAQSFPHSPQSKHPHYRNKHHPGQTLLKMERRTGEHKRWYMPPDPPWGVAGGTSSSSWQESSRPQLGQYATRDDRRAQPGQPCAMSSEKDSADVRDSWESNLPSSSVYPPLPQQQAFGGRPHVAMTCPLVSPRMTSASRESSQHGGAHYRCQSSGKLLQHSGRGVATEPRTRNSLRGDGG
ncbi:alpha-protein kinase 1-like [Acanthaster planci]|uniref:Alpha-protein kinase 1-like n=1 Tax=Acanthaster planci TaxID=133434 RepID=A0A8B7XRM1_ACAPL|nr:alpha-protein kinase 1-like [Acanthaster planci]